MSLWQLRWGLGWVGSSWKERSRIPHRNLRFELQEGGIKNVQEMADQSLRQDEDDFSLTQTGCRVLCGKWVESKGGHALLKRNLSQHSGHTEGESFSVTGFDPFQRIVWMEVRFAIVGPVEDKITAFSPVPCPTSAEPETHIFLPSFPNCVSLFTQINPICFPEHPMSP